MLKTKDDINAQKGKLSQQLSLVDTQDKKVGFFQNPKTVYYSFIVTILLSASLWLFSEVVTNIKGKTISINLPKINLPVVPPPKSSFNPETVIQKHINPEVNSNGLWSFYIFKSGLDYQKNSSQFNTPLTDLKNYITNLPKSTSSFATNLLPQGIDIKENLIENNYTLELHLLINLPSSNQMFIFIKNSSFSDINLVKEHLSKLIPDLYWQLVQLD